MENRTRYLPAYSIVPQPTKLSRVINDSNLLKCVHLKTSELKIAITYIHTQTRQGAIKFVLLCQGGGYYIMTCRPIAK
jgi:hypothetical protein